MKIFGVNISYTNYDSILKEFGQCIDNNSKLIATYVTAASLLEIKKDQNLYKIYNSFDIVHSDGIGVYLAFKLLRTDNNSIKRMTGSDLYPILMDRAIKNNWSFYFFGERNETLEKISNIHTKLKIAGKHPGYNFIDNKVVDDINSAKPDILIIGLGAPIQEKWVVRNKDRLNAKIIICVGQGIRVFSGEKDRGTKLLQKIGLEWFVRLCCEPRRLWRRYIIGIPLFIYYIIKEKISPRDYAS